MGFKPAGEHLTHGGRSRIRSKIRTQDQADGVRLFVRSFFGAKTPFPSTLTHIDFGQSEEEEEEEEYVTQRRKCQRTKCNLAHGFQSGWFHREGGQQCLLAQ